MFEDFGDVNLLANPGMCQLFVCVRECVCVCDREREIKVCTHVCIVCFVMCVTDVLGYLKDRSVCRQTQMKTRKNIDIEKISPLANIFS
jgi:hypothetical protein